MKRNVESDAKVQLLCERVTKLEEQKELLREQAEKYRKSNHKLTEKVMEFEVSMMIIYIYIYYI